MGSSGRSSTPSTSVRSTERASSNLPATETGDVASAKAAPKKKSGGILSKSANFVTIAILFYATYVAKQFSSILYPKFPDVDPNTHKYIEKFNNVFKKGETLHAKLWVKSKKSPVAEFDFKYDYDSYEAVSKNINVTVTQDQLKRGKNVYLNAEVTQPGAKRATEAKGGMVKQMKKPEVRAKYLLLQNKLCQEDVEPGFGKKNHIGRGIPKMQVRLVFDTTAYPYYYVREPYVPKLFVDEFWMTDDALIKLNTTGNNTFETEVTLSLMSAARMRFQQHMEFSISQNAKVFGEDSEEMLQMRDLFANTNSYLLITTMVVSVLHIIFEFLAFKNDVEFWQNCDTATLNKYMSVQSIVVGIFMQILVLLYLWDESANILVLATNIISILIDAWKVQRAMKFTIKKVCGIPLPWLAPKDAREKSDNFDSIAMWWLAVSLSPFIVGYGIYTMTYDCHRGWYSLFLNFAASCVYSLGFVLMTPQVFINYKHKSVAYLPWRKFVYRAINTFIDDLFALIIRMPTMHRLSAFRDDIVFIIYLYQKWCYPVDKSRTFDEDGYELAPEEISAADSKKDN